MRTPQQVALTTVVTLGLSVSVFAQSSSAGICRGYGPQTPRDIDNLHGTNSQHFSYAPDYTEMNLCNIHFHQSAEHKADAFSTPSRHGGFECAISRDLSKKERKEPAEPVCGGLKPGATIEVHWVHSSCQVAPGPGLGSCLSESCANPDLRVETQVFTLVNDPEALDFRDLDVSADQPGGLYQAKAIPATTGAPVKFLGSTTGPQYTQQKCSPLQVSWSVRPRCAKLDINSLAAWCNDNVFDESEAHGVRELVTAPELLAPID